jgi:crotonobetainyl-CoA:carnitine CoA-transferase CaiB-like acyl-CoA transferase
VSRGLTVTLRDSAGKPVELVNSPFRIEGLAPPLFTMPPGLGEQTEEVLRRLLGA